VSPITAGLLGSALLVFLLFSDAHCFVRCWVGFLGISYLASVHAALPVVAKTVYETAAHYPIHHPLFILMGGFAGNAGITRELYQSFDKWFRKLPGGLGIATIAACACFGSPERLLCCGCSGDGNNRHSGDEALSLRPKLATGIVAAGGTLSFLIPPARIRGLRNADRAIHRKTPDLRDSSRDTLSLAFIVIIVVEVKMDPSLAPATPGEVTWKEKLLAFSGVWRLCSFFSFHGGIYLGLSIHRSRRHRSHGPPCHYTVKEKANPEKSYSLPS